MHQAISRDPCNTCGVPGFRGCAHQLPCDPPAIPFLNRSRQPRPVQGKNPSRVWL